MAVKVFLFGFRVEGHLMFRVLVLGFFFFFWFYGFGFYRLKGLGFRCLGLKVFLGSGLFRV